MALTLRDSVEKLAGVGKKRAELYAKLSITTIGELLLHFPREYLDLSHPIPIEETQPGEVYVVRATVMRKQGEQRIRKGLSIFRVFVSDDSGAMTVTIFNSAYQFAMLEEGETYLFYGKMDGTFLKKEMRSPQIFPDAQSSQMYPVYPLTQGITNKQVQSHMREALHVWGDCLSDKLPEGVRREYGLCQFRYALETIHFPPDSHALAVARERLIFEELLTLSLSMHLLRQKNRVQTSVSVSDVSLAPFLESLPFSLTNGQMTAIRESLADMQGDVPMNRLCQGDVGCGKTMVAAALAYVCAKNGLQTAVMAPTQILAEQHARTFEKILAPLGISCGLLTGSMGAAARRDQKERLASGEIQVIAGTHALLQEEVSFHALGLVVTDEQHRFGVLQRAALCAKGNHPHLLVMSATPIPRTLALLIYGDLDISQIAELPGGRKPIKTTVIPSKQRRRALSFVREQIRAGRQAYIVCPLIDENEMLALSSVKQYVESLAESPLADVKIGLLHGKLKPKEKDALMQSFASGETNVLVSTTVVEVGVDVPNATVMMIENAERFGLSQLHQLRGRVGRGAFESYCILVSDNQSEETKARLDVMKRESNGFVIAREDLRLRGPGDFFGSRQHGLPKLRIANLVNDTSLLHKAQDCAKQILAKDPPLSSDEHRGLRKSVQRMFLQSGQTTLN